VGGVDSCDVVAGDVTDGVEMCDDTIVVVRPGTEPD